MAGTIEISILSNRFPALLANIAGAGVVVQKAVSDVEAGWEARAPVDTGAYRNSIHGEMVGPTEGLVSSAQEYGPYLEWGTHKMAAQPSATPAAEAVGPAFEAAIAALVGRL